MKESKLQILCFFLLQYSEHQQSARLIINYGIRLKSARQLLTPAPRTQVPSEPPHRVL